ncbi:MAG: hypothetical protein HC800_18220 [Phormidesmis sp. RL_2_1]|nr:hypothetical protein [Phormidesmis sp. RL_2_1]
MNILLIAMIVVLLIPLYEACQDDNIWQKMLAFASIETKTSMIILVIAVLRDDWMIGVVGVLILSLGNASLMLLAHLLRLVRLKHLNPQQIHPNRYNPTDTPPSR